MTQLSVQVYKDDRLFRENELIFNENNPSSKTIAFINAKTLAAHNVNLFSYFLINEKKVVCVFGSESVHEGQIYISFSVAASLQLPQQEPSTVTLNLDRPIPTRDFQQGSPYNFLPKLPICNRIMLSNIMNGNSSLFEAGIIAELIQEVFFVSVGDVIALDISRLEDLSRFQSDKKRLTKLIKFALTRENQSDPLDPLPPSAPQKRLYQGSKRLLLLQVENIFLLSSPATTSSSSQQPSRELIPFYQDKEHGNSPAFIVDIKNKETDIRLDQARHNKSPIPALNISPWKESYLQFIEQAILKHPIYDTLLKNFDKMMNHSFSRHIPLLLIGPKGSGKKLFLRYLSERYGMNYIEKDVKKAGNMNSLERMIMKGVNTRPCILHLRNVRSLVHLVQQKTQEEPEKLMVKQIQELITKFESLELAICSSQTNFLVLSLDKFDESSLIDNNLKNIFPHFFQLQKLSETGIYTEMLNFFFKQSPASPALENLLRVASGLPIFTFQKALLKSMKDHSTQSIEIIQTKLTESIENLRKSSDMESLSIPNVRWEDVGGLQDAKNDIIDTIMLPQMYPEIFDEFVRPRTGLLFFGPPGTGKTLLAKCIATETKMNFLSVKGPELLNMYIGESEKNVRDIFSKARRNQPCVIFFDELDALAPNRGNGSDSSQVMDRIVAQFLTELDDINKEGASIFVVGATNRPDLLDQGLLRPGRFDKLIYLGINTDDDTRTKILQAQTRKLQLESSVEFPRLLELIPKNFTGADFYGLTSQTVLKAARRKIREIEQIYQEKKKEKGEKYSFNAFSEDIQLNHQNLTQVTISFEDFDEALQKITPSVSQQELAKYEELRQKFQ